MTTSDISALNLLGKTNVYSLMQFFPNGYGASIVSHPMTYGGHDGLFEIAVLRGNPDSAEICYKTPITSDVVGFLDFQGVADTLKKIAALPPAK